MPLVTLCPALTLLPGTIQREQSRAQTAKLSPAHSKVQAVPAKHFQGHHVAGVKSNHACSNELTLCLTAIPSRCRGAHSPSPLTQQQHSPKDCFSVPCKWESMHVIITPNSNTPSKSHRLFQTGFLQFGLPVVLAVIVSSTGSSVWLGMSALP